MVTLDRDDILAALDELVEVLIAAGTRTHIRIVGGAAIAARFTRDGTTADVDALYGSAPEVEAAAQYIARRKGWPDDWLNDRVKAFASHFDGPDDWVSFDVRDGVEVRIADAPLLLAMKLRAARGRRDAADIDLLLDAWRRPWRVSRGSPSRRIRRRKAALTASGRSQVPSGWKTRPRSS